MIKIPFNKYLEDSMNYSEEEKKLGQEFSEWLPKRIIDCHAHCNLARHILDIDEQIIGHMGSTFLDYSLERSQSVKKDFFPGKKVQTLRFSHPMQGIDLAEANRYLLEKSPMDDRVALCGIPTNIDYVVDMLRNSKAVALKMYYSFFIPPVTKIYEFFKPEILETAQTENIPIILHLPKPITSCVNDLDILLGDFPDLCVVLAHLGVPIFSAPGLKEIYDHFAKHPNVFMDTSMITSSTVIELALKAFGTQRIMYGSDEPLNLMRAKTYTNPELGQRMIAEYKYHWLDLEEHRKYSHLAKGVVHMHWQALIALKEAIENLFNEELDIVKNDIFYGNAKKIFSF